MPGWPKSQGRGGIRGRKDFKHFVLDQNYVSQMPGSAGRTQNLPPPLVQDMAVFQECAVDSEGVPTTRCVTVYHHVEICHGTSVKIKTRCHLRNMRLTWGCQRHTVSWTGGGQVGPCCKVGSMCMKLTSKPNIHMGRSFLAVRASASRLSVMST